MCQRESSIFDLRESSREEFKSSNIKQHGNGSKCLVQMFGCMYVCMYVYVCLCMTLYVYVYLSICTYVYVQYEIMYVCINVM